MLVSSLVFNALSGGVLRFVVCVSFPYPSADWLDISTANQHLSNNRFLLATQKAKRGTPPESAVKSGLENCVRLYVLFCLTSFSL